MIRCEICGQQVSNTQALAGHKRFKHGIRPSGQLPLEPERHFATRAELVKYLAALAVWTARKQGATGTFDFGQFSRELNDILRLMDESGVSVRV